MSARRPPRHSHNAAEIIGGRFSLQLLAAGTPSAGQVLRGDGSWAAITPAMLGTGTPGAGTFLRGDGTWAAAGGGAGGTATVTVPHSSYSVEQTVTATGVTPTSRITLSLGPMPPTAENSVDLLRIAAMGAVPGTDEITVQMAFLTPTTGAIPLNWSAA
jgi:hypothetical protein